MASQAGNTTSAGVPEESADILSQGPIVFRALFEVLWEFPKFKGTDIDPKKGGLLF